MDNISDIQFENYRKLIYERFGITLSDAKKEMLQSKLCKVMRLYKIISFDDLYKLLQKEKEERSALWSNFTDVITIHKTDFFRENQHFEFIRNKAGIIIDNNTRISKNNEIRAWSAGCSTGEEAYSLAISLKESVMGEGNIKILATDVSSRVLVDAKNSLYPSCVSEEIGQNYLRKYFIRSGNELKVADSIKDLVTFRLFNLVDAFPFKNTFDIIFCRNVMIYFDSYTQQRLLEKFYDVMAPGGLIFIGHSESLTNKIHKYKYIEPTIYMK